MIRCFSIYRSGRILFIDLCFPLPGMLIVASAFDLYFDERMMITA